MAAKVHEEEEVVDVTEEMEALRKDNESLSAEVSRLKREVNSVSQKLHTAQKAAPAAMSSDTEATIGLLLSKTIQSEMLNLAQRVSKSTKILDNKIEPVMAKLDAKIDEMNQAEQAMEARKAEMEDAEKRCKDFNTTTCFINILFNKNRIWSITSNQTDSRLVNMMVPQIKACQAPYERTIAAVMRKHKLDLSVQSIRGFKDYFSPDDLVKTYARSPVTDMVWKRRF